MARGSNGSKDKNQSNNQFTVGKTFYKLTSNEFTNFGIYQKDPFSI